MNFSGQKKWISEAPLNQGVNQYPERAVSVQVWYSWAPFVACTQNCIKYHFLFLQFNINYNLCNVISSTCSLTVGLWPVWGPFTPFILFVLFMGFVVLVAMLPNFWLDIRACCHGELILIRYQVLYFLISDWILDDGNKFLIGCQKMEVLLHTSWLDNRWWYILCYVISDWIQDIRSYVTYFLIGCQKMEALLHNFWLDTRCWYILCYVISDWIQDVGSHVTYFLIGCQKMEALLHNFWLDTRCWYILCYVISDWIQDVGSHVTYFLIGCQKMEVMLHNFRYQINLVAFLSSFWFTFKATNLLFYSYTQCLTCTFHFHKSRKNAL